MPTSDSQPISKLDNIVKAYEVGFDGVGFSFSMEYLEGLSLDRVAPNLMVVVPTSKHVHLEYAHTITDYFAYLLTLLGLVLIFVFRRYVPITYRTSTLAGGFAGGWDPAPASAPEVAAEWVPLDATPPDGLSAVPSDSTSDISPDGTRDQPPSVG